MQPLFCVALAAILVSPLGLAQATPERPIEDGQAERSDDEAAIQGLVELLEQRSGRSLDVDRTRGLLEQWAAKRRAALGALLEADGILALLEQLYPEPEEDGTAGRQQAEIGAVCGVVLDQQFDAPLPLVQVTILETGERALSRGRGEFEFPTVLPGRYTLVFARRGFDGQLKTDVVVTPGQRTQVKASLAGTLQDTEQFVVPAGGRR